MMTVGAATPGTAASGSHTSSWSTTPGRRQHLDQGASGGPIPRAVRRAFTRSLADVGPLSFMRSGDAVIIPGSCGEVRDRGILITLGPVDGVGGQAQVSVTGHVSCVAANSVMYRVERTSGGWRVAGVAARGPVS
jgi:hypothetical protein